LREAKKFVKRFRVVELAQPFTVLFCHAFRAARQFLAILIELAKRGRAGVNIIARHYPQKGCIPIDAFARFVVIAEQKEPKDDPGVFRFDEH
jgi:hypothetical protein